MRPFLLLMLVFATASLYSQDVKWLEGRLLAVEGRAGHGERKSFYSRLPDTLQPAARKELWDLSQHSAGLCIRFTTNSKNLLVKWNLRFKNDMPHLTSCVTNGVDLYAFDDERGQWLWAGIVKSYNASNNSGYLLKDIPKKVRQYMLYLPMYNGVDSVFIGVDSDADIRPLARLENKGALVFYGTSITQGASASRAGLAATAILGRFFDVEVVNLGFSGNARMEEVVGKAMASSNALCYIVDCLPNMTKEMLEERAIPFLQQLRAASAATPIVLVGSSRNEGGWINQKEEQRIAEKNATLRGLYKQLVDSGFLNIHFVDGDELVGYDHEAAIDGVHLNDLGFYRYAERLKPVLAKILSAVK